VVDHLAPGVGAANSRTGIDAFLTDAGCCETALRTDDALWAAVGRTSGKVGLARADAGAVHLPLLAVGAARIRITRIFRDNWFNRWRGRSTR